MQVRSSCFCRGVAVLLVFTTSGVPAFSSRSHAQEHAGSLKAVTKVRASAEVQAIMADVRRRVLTTHTLITHRRLSLQSAKTFSKAISDLANRLEVVGPENETQKISILLREGASSIGKPPSGNDRMDGLLKLETALSLYPKLFDDEAWKPLR